MLEKPVYDSVREARLKVGVVSSPLDCPQLRRSVDPTAFRVARCDRLAPCEALVEVQMGTRHGREIAPVVARPLLHDGCCAEVRDARGRPPAAEGGPIRRPVYLEDMHTRNGVALRWI